MYAKILIMEWEEYQKQCYLLSRYKDRYLADASFEKKATALIDRKSVV